MGTVATRKDDHKGRCYVYTVVHRSVDSGIRELNVVFLDVMMDKLVNSLVEQHASTWSDKTQLYWFVSLIEECIELGLALIGLHEHDPGFELAQIASIAINWRRHIT